MLNELYESTRIWPKPDMLNLAPWNKRKIWVANGVYEMEKGMCR